MNMIEKVARAIFDNKFDECDRATSWEKQAKAAFEVMREPTRAMYNNSGLNQIIDYGTFNRAWNDVIDAALKEE